MNKRKLFGTIVGIVFWSICVVFFTYAYYEWKSDETSVVIGIEDLSTKCIPGTDVNATNIGPVLDYKDGVISEFSIKNEMAEVMAIDLRLDITSISDNLLTKSFKYAVVTDTKGGTNYDYDNPIIEGSFTNFSVGSNLILNDLAVSASITQSFLFIVYIDGNMYNNPNMQENSLVANLMIGNCEENSLPMDKLLYQAIYSADDNSLTFIHTTPLAVGDTYNNKAVTAVYTGFETRTYSDSSSVPWYADGNYVNITSVTFESVVSPVSTAYWFYGFNNLTSIDLERLDTSNVTSMYAMFWECSSLTSLNVSDFDTSDVIKMSYMFGGCSSLTSLDVSSFDTSNVTTMYAMFYGCSSLTSLNVSNFNTSNIIDMTAMFYDCSSLTSLDLSDFDTSNVTNMSIMFYGCSSLTSLDLSGFDTSNVTNMYIMFYDCSSLTSLDLSSFDTSKVTDMGFIFWGCSSLTSLDVSIFDTSNVTNMQNMFQNCESLTSLDVSDFDTSDVINMSYMFSGCSSLTSLDLSSFDTSNVKRMAYMFAYIGGSLTSLDVSSFDTSNVISMTSMFNACFGLTNLDVSGFNTSNVTTMDRMFWRCSGLTVLDVSNWNTSKVTNMEYMFGSCSKLINLNVSNFNTSNVTNMSGVFSNCSSLTSLNLSGWDTTKVTCMNSYTQTDGTYWAGMFEGCTNLTTTITIKNASTAYDNMFLNAAIASGAKITVNYTSVTSTLVDSMIATATGNVVKGSLVA